jgi:hypothetical protein
MGRKKGKRKADTKEKARLATSSRSSTERATVRTARSAPRLTSMVPVRFEPMMLDEVRHRAEQDGRSVSAWIRRAVEAELRRAHEHG